MSRDEKLQMEKVKVSDTLGGVGEGIPKVFVFIIRDEVRAKENTYTWVSV